MSRRASYLAVAAAAALGFALIAWVSSAGSVQMLQTPKATASPPQLPRPTAQQQGQAAGAVGTPTPAPSETHGLDLSWIGGLLSVLLLFVAVIALVLLTRWAWRKRWHRTPGPPVVPFEVLPEVSVALAKDAPAQLAALVEGSPRNAIVACWLRLEEAAAEAGVPRDPAETSAEFTARVLGALAFDPAMINGFAGLYREARFSRHELGEPARRAAVAALRSLYADIATAGLATSDLRPPDLATSDLATPDVATSDQAMPPDVSNEERR